MSPEIVINKHASSEKNDAWFNSLQQNIKYKMVRNSQNPILFSNDMAAAELVNYNTIVDRDRAPRIGAGINQSWPLSSKH